MKPLVGVLYSLLVLTVLAPLALLDPVHAQLGPVQATGKTEPSKEDKLKAEGGVA